MFKRVSYENKSCLLTRGYCMSLVFLSLISWYLTFNCQSYRLWSLCWLCRSMEVQITIICCRDNTKSLDRSKCGGHRIHSALRLHAVFQSNNGIKEVLPFATEFLMMTCRLCILKFRIQQYQFWWVSSICKASGISRWFTVRACWSLVSSIEIDYFVNGSTRATREIRLTYVKSLFSC